MGCRKLSGPGSLHISPVRVVKLDSWTFTKKTFTKRTFTNNIYKADFYQKDFYQKNPILEIWPLQNVLSPKRLLPKVSEPFTNRTFTKNETYWKSRHLPKISRHLPNFLWLLPNFFRLLPKNFFLFPSLLPNTLQFFTGVSMVRTPPL